MIAADISAHNQNVHEYEVKSYAPKDCVLTRNSAINAFSNIDVDCRGQEVTSELFRSTLLGAQDNNYNVHSRSSLSINKDDNTITQMKGHKRDKACIMHEMKLLKRFRNIMWPVDAC